MAMRITHRRGHRDEDRLYLSNSDPATDWYSEQRRAGHHGYGPPTPGKTTFKADGEAQSPLNDPFRNQTTHYAQAVPGASCR